MEFSSGEILALLFRWLHILAAMAAVGGLMFMRFALLPAATVLAEPQRQALQEAIRSRWAKVVMAAIGILLVSGFYNFVVLFLSWKTWPEAWRSGPEHVYQMLFGIKFVLALVIFFISSALAGRSPALARFRENAKFWVTTNLILAIVLVAISSQLRMMHAGPPVPRATHAEPVVAKP
jgi:uncharacterized membrane protein